MKEIVETNYSLISSMTGGIYEVFKTKKELDERIDYIKNNKKEFKYNSLIYVRKDEWYIRNENKYLDQTTLEIIDCKGDE